MLEDYKTETAFERRQRDFDDQQNEAAGRDVGRIKRFGVGETHSPEGRAKKRAREQAQISALDTLLRDDPDYRKLYEDLGAKLSAAEITADQSIAETKRTMVEAKTNLDDMRDGAPQLPDGRRVFRDKEGVVWDEMGAQIPEEIAEGIIWPEGATSHEAFLAQKSHAAELETYLHDLQRYRDGTLGDVRNRYDDEDNPISKDEMEAALEDIQAKMPAAPTPMDPGSDARVAPVADNAFKIPDLKG